MARHFAYGFRIIIIHFKNLLFFLFFEVAYDNTLFHGCLTDISSVSRVIGNHFRNNILCAGNRFFHSGHTFFF